MSTKVVTGKVRFSFCHIWEPQDSDDGGDPKYSVTLLIPKTDTVTVGKIQTAMKEAEANYRAKNGSASLPPKPSTTIHDGDGTRANGEAYGPECKGCWVITVSSKVKPVVVDAFKNEITNPSEVYSGCYGRACCSFYGYNSHGKKGISAQLLSIQKLSDGEPFGSVGSASDFDDDFVDATVEDDDSWM